jgi:hypothetical protein
MPVRSDSMLGRWAIATRTRTSLLTVTVSRPLAQFLIAAGARPHKENPQTILEERIGLRHVWITCREVLETLAELELIQSSTNVRSAYGAHRTAYELAVNIWRRLRDLYEFVKKRRFDDVGETQTVRRVIRSSQREARLILWDLNGLRGQRHSMIHPEPIDIIHPESIEMMLDDLRRLIDEWLGASPLDLRGINLKNLQMSVDDVAGALWDSSTIWPSESFAAEVRAESDEISPDVYRVRLGTEAGIFIF